MNVWEERNDPSRLLSVTASGASMRKLRLLACGIIRHAPFHADGRTVWELLPTFDRWFRPGLKGTTYGLDSYEAIELAELHADGSTTSDQLEIAQGVGQGTVYCAETDTPMYTDSPIPDWRQSIASAEMVRIATSDQGDLWLTNQLLGYRSLFSAPFPNDLHPDNGRVVCSLIRDILMGPERRKPINPKWVSETVNQLARSAYFERRFDLLPALGEALEVEGCTDQAMLRHCREPGVHARGCWALDRVLGKA